MHACAGPILCRPELSWPWRFVAKVSCYQKCQVKVDPETLKRKLQQAKLRTTESCKEDTDQSSNWFLQFIEEAGSCEGASSFIL